MTDHQTQADSCCLACGKNGVTSVLNMGVQPPSNLFLARPDQSYPLHPLHFGICEACGMLQLVDPMPKALSRCTHDWLHYNEPEQHLDQLATILASYKKPTAYGASYKDDSLLLRLKELGCHILSGEHKTVQPKPAMLIARHILEHSRNPQIFVARCVEQIAPDGMIVFEVPGAEQFLANHWHHFVWEEHILYFTRTSLPSFLHSCGLEVLEMLEFAQPMENSLVAIVRPAMFASRPDIKADAGLGQQLYAALAFGLSLPQCRAAAQKQLEKARKAGQPTCLFGAGHLGMKFVNFYGLAPFLDAVLDDTPQKQGSFLPKTLLPILSSEWLKQNPSAFCFLAVNPENQKYLRKRHAFFAAKEEAWQSIFPTAPSWQGIEHGRTLS